MARRARGRALPSLEKGVACRRQAGTARRAGQPFSFLFFIRLRRRYSGLRPLGFTAAFGGWGGRDGLFGHPSGRTHLFFLYFTGLRPGVPGQGLLAFGQKALACSFLCCEAARPCEARPARRSRARCEVAEGHLTSHAGQRTLKGGFAPFEAQLCKGSSAALAQLS